MVLAVVAAINVVVQVDGECRRWVEGGRAGCQSTRGEGASAALDTLAVKYISKHAEAYLAGTSNWLRPPRDQIPNSLLFLTWHCLG